MASLMTEAELAQTAQAIAEHLGRVERVLVVSHISPDGDTLGSSLGLAWALRGRGLSVRLACADPVPPELHFLPGHEAYTADGPGDEQLILVVDASDLERIGRVYRADRFAAVPVVNIDHHVTNLRFGDLNYLDPKASTAELILDLLTAWGAEIDKIVATCLLTGMVTDTRGFRTNSATAEVLRATVRLVDAGASLPAIMDAVFNHRPLELLRLWGLAMAAAQVADGVLWVEVSQEMLRQAQATPAAAKGLANFMSTFDGPCVTVILRELETRQVEVSFRSRPSVDVSGVALAFGGGGHPQASGCLVSGRLRDVRDRVLAALQVAILEQTGSGACL